jgi:hypothetical protein
MTEFFIIFGISFIVFVFLALVLYLKERPGKKSSAPSYGCASNEQPKTGCAHCSEQFQVPPQK